MLKRLSFLMHQFLPDTLLQITLVLWKMFVQVRFNNGLKMGKRHIPRAVLPPRKRIKLPRLLQAPQRITHHKSWNQMKIDSRKSQQNNHFLVHMLYKDLSSDRVILVPCSTASLSTEIIFRSGRQHHLAHGFRTCKLHQDLVLRLLQIQPVSYTSSGLHGWRPQLQFELLSLCVQLDQTLAREQQLESDLLSRCSLEITLRPRGKRET